jgi:hypothetical protein
LTLNMRRPWLPVRGWMVQQIMKLAMTAAMEARAVLIMDSDAVLLRRPTLDQFTHDGRLSYFRKDDAVTVGMDRHLLWHRVSRKLLGLPGSVSAPAPDYVSPITVWDPAIVRDLLTHIAETTGRNWIDAVSGQLHFSEFMIYGVFVDHVLEGRTPFSGPLCHNYYRRVPLRASEARGFADETPQTAIGAMISSHSHTAQDVRRATFRQCAQVVDRGTFDSVPVPSRRSATKRLSWEHRCLDAAMLLAPLCALAPAG